MSERAAQETSRPITESERSVIEKILNEGRVAERWTLSAQLRDARVSRTTLWMLDIEVSAHAFAAQSVSSGPLGVQAFVPNDADYRGELIVWTSNGFITGLEYAYVTDYVPQALPALEDIKVVPARP